jgi:hypothetical protein
MADFYPLLVRAVAKLTIDSPQARQELYDHARNVLVTQLSRDHPRASAPEIMREQIALEAAIRSIEAQSQASRPRNGLRLGNSASFPSVGTTWPRYVADREWHDVCFDHTGQRAETPASSGADPQWEISANDEASPPAAIVTEKIADTPDHVPIEFKNAGIEKIAPRKLSNGTSIRMSRDHTLRSDQQSKQQERSQKPSATKETLESKTSAFFDPTMIALASIVAMLTIIVAISTPAAMIYFPRLIWFSEHLTDRPMLIIGILMGFGVALLLVFPIFGTRRRNSLRSNVRVTAL